MDFGVAVGYLVAYLSGKAKRLADQAVNDLLERLYAKVALKLRHDPAMQRLEDDPSDDRAQADVVRSLSALAASGDQVVDDLRRLVAELDRREAQKLVVAAPVYGQVFQQVTASQGSIVGSIGRDVNIFQDLEAHALNQLREAALWVKALVALGTCLAFVGLGIFFVTMFTHNPQPGDPDFADMPLGVPLAFGTFFTGLVLAGIASMTVSLRRRH